MCVVLSSQGLCSVVQLSLWSLLVWVKRNLLPSVGSKCLFLPLLTLSLFHTLSQLKLLQTLPSFSSGSILILSCRLLMLFTTNFFASYFVTEHCTCYSPLQCRLRVLSAGYCAMLPVPSYARCVGSRYISACYLPSFLAVLRFPRCWLVLSLWGILPSSVA